MKTKLLNELKMYRESNVELVPYLGMIEYIVSTRLFNEQLQEILNAEEMQEIGGGKKFRLYLDAVIINMQTKIAKYKPSTHCVDEQVFEIENQGYVIPFYNDEANEKYVLLGIIKKSTNDNDI